MSFIYIGYLLDNLTYINLNKNIVISVSIIYKIKNTYNKGKI